jgi:hypothetical protein
LAILKFGSISSSTQVVGLDFQDATAPATVPPALHEAIASK